MSLDSQKSKNRRCFSSRVFNFLLYIGGGGKKVKDTWSKYVSMEKFSEKHKKNSKTIHYLKPLVTHIQKATK